MLARDIRNEKRPLASNITSPFAFGPKRSVLVPSLFVSIDATNVQFPTSCSLSDFCWAMAPELVIVPAHSATAYSARILRRFISSSFDLWNSENAQAGGAKPYLTRFQPTSAVPPIDAGRTVHLISSPVNEITFRF